MKVEISELTGPALDWAVAKCEGRTWEAVESFIAYHEIDCEMNYSTDWAQGGPIIDRMLDSGAEMVQMNDSHIPVRDIFVRTKDGGWIRGSTALIAAMRCYVASVIGNAVDVPDELAV